jgi:hypothetical protein
VIYEMLALMLMAERRGRAPATRPRPTRARAAHTTGTYALAPSGRFTFALVSLGGPMFAAPAEVARSVRLDHEGSRGALRVSPIYRVLMEGEGGAGGG